MDTSANPVDPTTTATNPMLPPPGRAPQGVGWRQRCVVHETPGRLVLTEGFIQREIARKQWIYEIIDGEREADKVLYDCADFMVLPDADAQNVAGRILNWLVIFKDRTLRSVRDLRGGDSGHLHLLRRVRQTLRQILLPSQDDTMLYFHCPPSVWQLHLHVAFPCDVLRTTNDMQKVQFLDDVISNLEIDHEYYKKATMTYVLPIGHELIRLYTPGYDPAAVTTDRNSPPFRNDTGHRPTGTQDLEEEEVEEEREEDGGKQRGRRRRGPNNYDSDVGMVGMSTSPPSTTPPSLPPPCNTSFSFVKTRHANNNNNNVRRAPDTGRGLRNSNTPSAQNRRDQVSTRAGRPAVTAA
jgi:m7GpppX diphosphatase